MATDIVGKFARVTGEIAPGHVGEIVCEVRNGTERFLAFAADRTERIPKHTTVLIVASLGGRTVEVAPATSH